MKEKRSYVCMICGIEFGRSRKHASVRRCSECQQKYREGRSGSGALGNKNHRPPGHNTRGIHKPKIAR